MTCRECRPLRTQVARLQARLKDLEMENRTLRRRLALHENSNTPPSVRATSPGWQGGPSTGTEKGTEKRKRPGQKPGHPGVTRPPLVPDQEETLSLKVCPNGVGHRLGESRNEDRFQIELPPPQKAWVTLYHVEVRYCEDCGAWVSAPLPGGSWQPGYGPHFKAEVVESRITERLPLRRLQRRLMRYGQKVSLRTLEQLLFGASDRLKGEYEELLRRIRLAKVVYADETSFRVAVAGKKWWLWVFTTTDGDVLLVMRPSRGEDVVREVLGEGFAGKVVVCDGWKAYPSLRLLLLQRCWAHLVRKAREASERHPRDWRVRKLSKELSALYRWSTRRAEATTEVKARAELRRKAERKLRSLVQRYEGSRSSVVQSVLTYVRNGEPWWFTFIDHEGVEPTNNRAERALREAVVIRKIIGTLRSKRGAEAFERLMTVVLTWQNQGRPLHDELVAALQ